MKKRTALWITLSKAIGLIIFLLILWVLNSIRLENPIAVQVVNFLNANLLIIIIMSILFYLGELFGIFHFPFNIPSPLFNAIGGFLLVGFIFQMLFNIGQVTGQDIMQKFIFLSPLVATFVFIIVIVVGYIKIFYRSVPSKKKIKRKEKRKRN